MSRVRPAGSSADQGARPPSRPFPLCTPEPALLFQQPGERPSSGRRDAEGLVSRGASLLELDLSRSEPERRREKRGGSAVRGARFGGGRDTEDQASGAYGVDAPGA